MDRIMSIFSQNPREDKVSLLKKKKSYIPSSEKLRIQEDFDVIENDQVCIELRLNPQQKRTTTPFVTDRGYFPWGIEK